MCAQSVTPKSDGLNQPVELPWLVEIANSLPPDVEAPYWAAEWRSSETPYTRPLFAKAKQSLARVGICLERIDAAKFQRFLDEKFPREQFPEFRDLIDGPDLGGMVVRKQGLEAISAPPRSSLNNYRFFVTTRRALREGARLGAEIAARVRASRKGKKQKLLYPLRICAFCQNLFIARKNNNVYCDPQKCGAAFRQARKRNNDRDKQEEYEVKRQMKMAARELERKRKLKLKKRAS